MKESLNSTNSQSFFLKNPKRRKKIYTFSSFVLLSVFFWLIIKLSQESEARFHVEISIVNTSSEILVKDISHNYLTIDLHAIGARLFYMHITKQHTKANLKFQEFHQIRKGENIYYYITGEQAASAIPNFSQAESKIINVQPDTLFLEVESAKQKKVPVKFDSTINLPERHKIYNPIQIKPDSILVSGPKNAIDLIDELFVCTKDGIATVNNSIEKHFNIINPYPSMPLRFSNKEVKVIIDIKEFTESKTEVPLEIDCQEIYGDKINKIRLFPSSATIYYLIALDDYKQNKKDMFSLKVECPFEKISKDRLDIKIDNKPPNIEIIRVEPSRAEYILLE